MHFNFQSDSCFSCSRSRSQLFLKSFGLNVCTIFTRAHTDKYRFSTFESVGWTNAWMKQRINGERFGCVWISKVSLEKRENIACELRVKKRYFSFISWIANQQLLYYLVNRKHVHICALPKKHGVVVLFLGFKTYYS